MISNDATNNSEDKYNILELIQDLFKPNGPLTNFSSSDGRGYEYRKQQHQMAVAVADSLAKKKKLCIEAPTGVGKSFAYCAPSIIHALNEERPMLISTETINLQEQLMEKDLPILGELMGLDFKATLAKGRSNYLCLRRLRVLSGGNDKYLPNADAAEELAKLIKWSEKTNDGSRASVDFKISPTLFNCVCSEVGNCPKFRCEYWRHCFYWRARLEWEKADILVANHALFFTDLKIKNLEGLENSLLPEYAAVIFDEAHGMEDGAANHLGMRLSSMGTNYFLRRLYDPNSGRGLLSRSGEQAMELRRQVSSLSDSCASFFQRFERIMAGQSDSLWRVRSPGIAPDTVSNQMWELKSALDEYSKIVEDKNLKFEIEAQKEKCEYFSKGFHDFLNLSRNDHVYWLEKDGMNGRSNLTFYACPLNVNELLNNILFDKDKAPVILTSATLTVRGRMDYLFSRIGFEGESLVLDSPFDYYRQVKIHISKSAPAPNATDYHEDLTDHVRNYIELTHGKAFVLFTSYQTLRHCAENLVDYCESMNITLLVQGWEKSRNAMLREFRSDTNSVIFGTSSFWTGVDVPGESLSNVIITKLPFAVPSHPLVEARLEKMEQAGENAFMNYSLPEAVLRFRQGIGRLIRTSDDSGLIVILDPRIITKRYGKFFLESIPKCETIVE